MGNQLNLGLSLEDEFGHIWDRIADIRGQLDRLEARIHQPPAVDEKPPQHRKVETITEYNFYGGEGEIGRRVQELEATEAARTSPPMKRFGKSWSYYHRDTPHAAGMREHDEAKGPFSIGVKISGWMNFKETQISIFIHVLRDKDGLVYHAYNHKDRPVDCQLMLDRQFNQQGVHQVLLKIDERYFELHIDEPGRVGHGYLSSGNQRIGLAYFAQVPVNPFEE